VCANPLSAADHRDAGLLTGQALRRKQAADALLSIADRVAAAGIAPMSMQEINAEIKAERIKQRRYASRD